MPAADSVETVTLPGPRLTSVRSTAAVVAPTAASSNTIGALPSAQSSTASAVLLPRPLRTTWFGELGALVRIVSTSEALALVGA